VILLKNTGENCAFGEHPYGSAVSPRLALTLFTFDVPPAEPGVVFGWDTLVLLKHLLDEGLNKTDIATRLGVSRRVVHYRIQTGQLERDLETAPRGAMPPRRTKLDAYHAIIRDRLATHPELSATRLFEEVRAAGYTGGITQMREYVAQVTGTTAASA
jgi:transposase